MKPITILLIEDNTQDIRLIKEMLKEIRYFNYNLVSAVTLKEGCEQIQKNNFDIILLDLNLPDSIGQQTFQKVIDCCKEIPVVLITGNEDQELSVKLIMEGAQDYITKQSLNPASLEKSILYSIERQTLLSNIKLKNAQIDRIEKERILIAKFPSQDPEPVLRVAINGKLLYINEAGIKLLTDWQLIINETIPFWLKDIIDPIFIEGTNIEFELCRRELIYSFYAVPVIEEGYINLYGRNITERKRAEEELIIANKELVYENEEKEKRAMELIIANRELDFQQEEKGKRAEELIIANKELTFQNEEKEKRASELIMANKELEKSKSEIIKLNEVLEQKVEERTRQLAETNKNLNKENKERKRAEESSRRSEETRKMQFNNSSIGLLLCKMDGSIVDINSACANIIGRTLEESWKLTYWDITPKKYEAQEAEQLRSMEETGKYGPYFKELIHKDGHLIPVEVSGLILQINNEQFIWSSVQDITERKKADEQLILQSSALNAAANAIAITNIKGAIQWINPAFTKLTGYSFDEVFGANPSTLKSGKHNAAFYKNMWDTILSGEVWHSEMINKRKDGSEYNEEMTITPLKDEKGEISRFIAIKQDITERKVFEKEIQAAKLEADRANLAKSEFLSRMSHELRTPMNSILGFAQLMNMGELKPAHKKGVDHILKSGKHLLDLINEVLDLSRIEAGELSVSLEPVPLRGIVFETMDVIKPLATTKNITFEFPESPVCDLFVKADHQKLKQVLLNLLSNAVKYNREGGSVKVDCSLQSAIHSPQLAVGSPQSTVGNGLQTEDWSLKTVRISVTDTGKGIAPQYMERLFNPFERIGAEVSEVEGTGLGLAVSKKLIEAMNGTIGVESQPGVGSTFWIELPQAEGQIDRHELKGGFNKPVTESVVTGKLLYIEDNVSNIQLVLQILEIHRSQINLITDMYGKNTVKLATDYQPDVILLDLDLPDIHGSEVLKLLQREPKTKTIPVVIISANAIDSQIEKLLKAGASNYLTKPLDVLEFLRVVDRVIKRSGNRSNKR